MSRTSVTSTRAKVNPWKARDILSGYVLQGIEFEIDDQGYLRAAGEEGRDQEWPLAVPKSQLPPKKGRSRGEYRALVRDVYLQQGAEGFTALLRDLVSCLETPLLILAVWGSQGQRSGASAWRIRPGPEVVQALYACDDPAAVA